MLFSVLLACSLWSSPPPVVVDDPLTVLLRDEEVPVAVPSGPNVVLVIGCTVRQDQVGVYGGPAGVTPFLDGLAAEGTRMADPVTAAAWTRAASAALVTGRHPLELGLVDATADRNDRPLPADAKTLAERFQEAGYRTVGATANPNLNALFGFDQGFSTYVQPAHLWREDRHKLLAQDLVPRVLELAGDASGRPLFLQVLLVDAHAPFPPRDDRFADAPSAEMQLYRGALHSLDRAIGALATSLEQRGYAADDTLFVVVSDHGEGLSHPPHHGKSHGRYLYSSAVQGVWMLRGPGVPVGQTVEGVVSMIDLVPTLTSLAGLPVPTVGRDLVPSIREGRSSRASAIADSWFRGSNRAAIYTDDLACMRSFHTDRPEPVAPTGTFVPGCYDRATDPLHLAPLDPIPPAGLAALTELTAWRAARPVDGAVDEMPIDAALDAQLEALGYAE